MTDERSILTTITDAQRVPSIGTQLPAFGADPLPALTWAERYQPAARVERAPVALNLWDTSADSIPETWSTDR